MGEFPLVKDRMLQLVRVIPEINYGWRSQEDVRYLSEVRRHIAFWNYLIAKTSGYTVPPEVGLSIIIKQWDKTTSNKLLLNNLRSDR